MALVSGMSKTKRLEDARERWRRRHSLFLNAVLPTAEERAVVRDIARRTELTGDDDSGGSDARLHRPGGQCASNNDGLSGAGADATRDAGDGVDATHDGRPNGLAGEEGHSAFRQSAEGKQEQAWLLDTLWWEVYGLKRWKIMSAADAATMMNLLLGIARHHLQDAEEAAVYRALLDDEFEQTLPTSK